MLIKIVTLLLAAAVSANSAAESRPVTQGDRDGQVYQLSSNEFLAWDSESGRWLQPVAFWKSYQQRADGVAWPAGTEYPPYRAVSEHDTFLVETEKGSCLMYFFHTRWRRANDVRRWDDAFNDYGGCPYVFD